MRRGLALLLAALVVLSHGLLLVTAEEQVSAKIVLYDDGSGALVANTSLPAGMELSGYFYVVMRSDAIVIDYDLSGKVPQEFSMGLGQVMEFNLDAKGSKDKIEINYNLNVINNSDKLNMKSRETIEKRDATTHIEATLTLEASGQYSFFLDTLYESAKDLQSENNITVNIKDYEKGKKLELEIKADLQGQYARALSNLLDVPLLDTTMNIENLNLSLESAKSSARIDFKQGTFTYKGKITITGDIATLTSKTPAPQLLNEIIPYRDLSIDTTTSYNMLNYMSAISDELDNNLYITLPSVAGYQVNNNQLTVVFPRVKATSGNTEQVLEQIAKNKLNAANVEKTKASGDEPPVKLPDEVHDEYTGSGKRNMLLLGGIAIVVIAVIAVLIIRTRR